MSDSDLLGIIARNPVRRTDPPRRFRPLSPKPATAVHPKHSGLKPHTPSPPSSPEPLFKYGEDLQDDIHADDSASIVAESIQRRAPSPGSMLLDVMKNDGHSVLDAKRDTLQQESQRPPNDTVYPTYQSTYPPIAPPLTNRLPQGYVIKNYSNTPPGLSMGNRQPGLPFETVRYPTIQDTTAPLVEQPPPAPNLADFGGYDDTIGNMGDTYTGLQQANEPAAHVEDMREKEKLVAELHLKRSKGYEVPPNIGMHSSFDELHSHVENIRRLENHKRTVSMLRYLMIIGCTGAEKATMHFVSDVYLDGWSETIAANQNDYDDVLGRVADTMDLSTTIPPHLELIVMLGVSGVMFHMAKKNKSALDAIIKKSERSQPDACDTSNVRKPRQPKTQLTEEQLRIHDLITNGSVRAPHEYIDSTTPLETDDYDLHSNQSGKSTGRTRKRAKITIDSDDIVRLF